MRKLAKKSNNRRKQIVLLSVLCCLVLAGAVTAFVILRNDKPVAEGTGSNARTTSNAPSAQQDFKGDDQKTVPASTPAANASTTDQSSLTTANPATPASQWSSSKDGSSIVVYSPAPNAQFKTGDVVYGKAAASTVSYRLIDNVSGVITSGSSNVVNGTFSIKFSFTTSATQGDIEVYNQTSPYGPESNSILIPVRF